MKYQNKLYIFCNNFAFCSVTCLWYTIPIAFVHTYAVVIGSIISLLKPSFHLKKKKAGLLELSRQFRGINC